MTLEWLPYHCKSQYLFDSLAINLEADPPWRVQYGGAVGPMVFGQWPGLDDDRIRLKELRCPDISALKFNLSIRQPNLEG